MEEAAELQQRVKNEDVLPMFTSCCPSWVKYASIYHPELLKIFQHVNHQSECKLLMFESSLAKKRKLKKKT